MGLRTPDPFTGPRPTLQPGFPSVPLLRPKTCRVWTSPALDRAPRLSWAFSSSLAHSNLPASLTPRFPFTRGQFPPAVSKGNPFGETQALRSRQPPTLPIEKLRHQGEE